MTASQDPALEETIEDLASFDFAPWPARPGGWQPPTNDEWIALANPHLISVRLAWLTLYKSKEELANIALELGEASSAELVSQIGRSADWFKGLHELLASAEARLVCAGAALPEG